MHSQDHPGPSSPGAPRQARYVLKGQAQVAPALDPGLHIVATPIGNLRDMTVRAIETLAACDLIACEDTRVSRKLLDHYGISVPLLPYHDHNAAGMRPRLIERLADGAAVALVSDAGTPLISDPGYKLVRAVQEAGYAVHTVPGASSVLAALTVSGLPTDRFFFEGFLPSKSTQRQQRIADLARIPATLVLFESGPRVAETLADLAQGLRSRTAALCRELTKLHEEVRRADLPALASHYAGDAETRGEIVIVIAPPEAQEHATDPDRLDAMLRDALLRLSVKEAVAEIASVTGQPRRDVYQRALELKQALKQGRPE